MFLFDKCVVIVLALLAIVPFRQVLQLNFGFAIFDYDELLLLVLALIFSLIMFIRGLRKEYLLYVFGVFFLFFSYAVFSVAFLDASVAQVIQQVRNFLPFLVACLALLCRLEINNTYLLKVVSFSVCVSALTAMMLHLFFKEFIAYAFSSNKEVSDVIIKGGRMYWGSSTLVFFGFVGLFLCDKKTDRIFYFSILLVLCLGIVFTQNRTMLASVFLFYMMAKVFVERQPIRALATPMMMGSFVLLLFFLSSSAEMRELFEKRLFVSGNTNAELAYSLTVGRFYLYQQYYDVLRHSFPFGQGVGFPLAHAMFTDVPMYISDISLISLVLPFGVAGLWIYFGFLYKTYVSLRPASRLVKTRKSSELLRIMLVVAALVSLNIDMFTRNIFVVYFAVFVSIYAVSCQKDGLA